MSGQRRLVLASRNPGKLAEVRRILAGEVEMIGLDEVADYPEPAETGESFEENALIKARECVRRTGLPAVADDSGLCVDALNGMPGVLSARWSGRHGDDAANLALVLAQISGVPGARRGAAFVCAAALVSPSGTEEVVLGEVRGTLLRSPRGEGGFGYDPIFVPVGEDRTTAEMAPQDKDALSHRGRALRALAPSVRAHVGGW